MKSDAVKNLTFVIILTLVAAFGVSGCSKANQEQPTETLTIDESPTQIILTPAPEPAPAPVVEVPTPPECTTNENCSDGRVCTDGKCVAAEPKPECTTNEDCSDVFSHGICKKETGCKPIEDEIYKVVKEKYGNWKE